VLTLEDHIGCEGEIGRKRGGKVVVLMMPRELGM